MQNKFRGVIVYKGRKRTRKSAVQGSPTLWGAQEELLKAGAFNNSEVQRVYILNLATNKLVCEWVM